MKCRKSNRSKKVSPGCANNGSCGVCTGDRTHQAEKQLQETVEQLRSKGGDVLDKDGTERDVAR